MTQVIISQKDIQQHLGRSVYHADFSPLRHDETVLFDTNKVDLYKFDVVWGEDDTLCDCVGIAYMDMGKWITVTIPIFIFENPSRSLMPMRTDINDQYEYKNDNVILNQNDITVTISEIVSNHLAKSNGVKRYGLSYENLIHINKYIFGIYWVDVLACSNIDVIDLRRNE